MSVLRCVVGRGLFNLVHTYSITVGGIFLFSYSSLAPIRNTSSHSGVFVVWSYFISNNNGGILTPAFTILVCNEQGKFTNLPITEKATQFVFYKIHLNKLYATMSGICEILRPTETETKILYSYNLQKDIRFLWRVYCAFRTNFLYRFRYWCSEYKKKYFYCIKVPFWVIFSSGSVHYVIQHNQRMRMWWNKTYSSCIYREMVLVMRDR